MNGNTPRRSTRIAVKKVPLVNVEACNSSRPTTTSSTRSIDSGNATLGLDQNDDIFTQGFQTPNITGSRGRGRRARETSSSVLNFNSKSSTPNTNSRPLTVVSDFDLQSPFSDIPDFGESSSNATPNSSKKRGRPPRRRNINVIETPFQNNLVVEEIPQQNVSQNEISLVDDSFLCAVDKLEKVIQQKQQSEKNEIKDQHFEKENLFHTPKPVLLSQLNDGTTAAVTNNTLNQSPDIFADSYLDEDFLNMMPASQFELQPNGELPHHKINLNSSRRKSETKKRRSISFTGVAPMEVDFDPAVTGAADEEPRSKRLAQSKRNKKATEKFSTETKAKKKKKAKFKLAYTNRKAAKKLSSSGNNELNKDDLSCLSEEEKLLLSSWGLPRTVLAKYESKGITSLFPWQLECLANERVLEGRNLLYSAPTSAGKTLVAEILMIKRVIELGKKAIMILPFVSVCREKMYGLQEIFGDAGIRVEGFMGAYCPPGGFKAVDIAICTIEKANSLINRLLEENSLSQLGTIVVDELHLIGDPHRGYLLELLLTKIKFMTSPQRTSMDDSIEGDGKKLNIQIIGMSATLPNLNLLSSWLDAELVITDYRPVPLVERISHSGKIFDEHLKFVRSVNQDSLPVFIQGDDSNIVYLTLETVLAGHSVLIFCPTKAKCERLAEQIAKEFWIVGNPANHTLPELGQMLRNQLNSSKIEELLIQLKECPGGLEDVLKKTVSFGVAYHHAGLTYDERDIIEASFKRCVLRVIVATSTLSAGVNLPARRVIVSSPMAAVGPLDVMTYRQMCGRAGRKGVDSEGIENACQTQRELNLRGESILICSTSNQEQGILLVQSALPKVKSALLGDQGALTSSMKRALLEVIASKIATLPEDVKMYSKCSLLSKSIDAGLYEDNNELSASQENKEDTIQNCLTFLEQNDFIRLQRFEDTERPAEYMPTQLGSACLVSSMAPDEGITVYKELCKARKCFVLGSELHVVYQVTPIYLSDQLRNIPWLDFLTIWNDLNAEDKLVADLVGIEEPFLLRLLMGTVTNKDTKFREKFMIHQRFYAALALNDLVNEMPISQVSEKYTLNKGVIQNLQQSASTFAGMVTAFCGRLGWSNLELLLSQFQERLQFGVQRELCDLVRLSTMNGQRARVLYDKGIKTIMDLAASDPAHIESILHTASPFQSNVHGETGAGNRHIWVVGNNDGLSETEAAHKIVEEARQFIQMELGLPVDVQFNPLKKPDTSPVDLLGEGETEISSSEDEIEGIKDAPLSSEPSNRIQDNNIPSPSLSISPTTEEIIFEKIETKQKDSRLANDSIDDISIKDAQQVADLQITSNKSINKPKNQDCPTTDSRNAYSQNIDDAFFETWSQDMFPDEVLGLNVDANNAAELHKELVKRTENTILDDKMETSFEEEAKNILKEVFESSMELCESGSQEEHNNENNMTPKNETLENNQNDSLKHSTPVSFGNYLASSTTNETLVSFKTRLSAIVAPSLIDKFHPAKSSPTTSALRGQTLINNSNTITPTRIGFKSNDISSGNNEVDAELLAEFDKKFDSITSLIETSLNISDVVEEESKEVKKTATVLLNETPKLSESDVAAIAALINDSKFESDDMFAEVTEVSVKAPAPEKNVVSEKERSNLEEIDNSSSIFDDSSSFLESSFSLLSERKQEKPQSARNLEHDQSTTVLEAKLGSRIIKVKTVLASEFIPDEAFKGRIGLGIKIEPPKRATSIARSGIGAKIIGKASSSINNYADRRHELSIYNGEHTIWVFQWVDLNNNDVRRRSFKCSGLFQIFRKIKKFSSSVVMLDYKDNFRGLLATCGQDLLKEFPINTIMDPKIAQWMLQFDEENKWHVSFEKIVAEHLEPTDKIIINLGWNREIIESFVSFCAMNRLEIKLKNHQLWEPFTEIEMPSCIPLMLMEINGFGLDSRELSKMQKILQFKSSILELRSFQIAGRQFALTSPKDICQVLYKEIGLRQNPKSTSTDKATLSKIDHELPKIIIEWRKIQHALKKVVIPFKQEKSLETGRVHGKYSHFTVTGRVTMKDPSLQCIPRDFDLQMDLSPNEMENIRRNNNIKFGSRIPSLIQEIDRNVNCLSQGSIDKNYISMRNVFIPCSEEFCLVSGDYSQLELRILAHLSEDKSLIKALNLEGGDVFVEIAKQWKKLPADQITASMRQEAKGIVYGVIYGMGVKTLSEQMEVDIADASRFINEFMKTYPGVKTFLDKAVKKCQKEGFIETITGRRRYLSNINSNNLKNRAQAERQAINSQIQGSAADLVKTAMTKIHSQLSVKYPESQLPVNWSKYNIKNKSKSPATISTSSLCAYDLPNTIIYFPILNLHDELIFEVRKSHLKEVTSLIREQMEGSLKLKVRLPVVIKSGNTWGSLEKLL